MSGVRIERLTTASGGRFSSINVNGGLRLHPTLRFWPCCVFEFVSPAAERDVRHPSGVSGASNKKKKGK